MRDLFTIAGIFFSLGNMQKSAGINNYLIATGILFQQSIPGQHTPVATTAQNNIDLPQGIYLDTTKYFDKVKELTIEIVLPKSKDEKAGTADNLLANIINNKRDEFIQTIDSLLKADPSILRSETGSSFYIYPQAIYKNDHTISYLFTIESYQAASVHPVTFVYAFNYDLIKQKEIKFSDYFSLTTNAGKAFMVKTINRAFGNNQFIKVGTFYDFKFNFNKDNIQFDFSDYEIASYADGIQHAEISKKDLLKYIDPMYR